MTTPLGAFATTPLGAFRTTPLGARGPSAAPPLEGLYTCTMEVAWQSTGTQWFALASSATGEQGACGDQLGVQVGVANLAGAILAGGPVPIGGNPSWPDLFSTQPANLFWRDWVVTGDTSGAVFPFADVALSFTCTQRTPIDIRDADTMWSAGRSDPVTGWPTGVPIESQAFKYQPGQDSGIITYWNQRPNTTPLYPFINLETAVISGPPLP